jgi:hypothetical protein
MATRMCAVCGVRPAVVAVRRRIPGEGQTVQYLCELHAAEARGGRPPLGASSLSGGSLFDDFFDRFFDEGRTAIPGGGTALQRRAEQVDVTQFFSAATTELLQRAAQQALEWGSLDLTGEHLLYAALEDTVVRRVLEGAGADPDALRAQLEEEAQKGGRTDVSPLCPPMPRGRCSRPTTSPGPWVPRTSDPSTFCSPSRPMTSRMPAGSSRVSGSRTPGCAGPWCAASRPAARFGNQRARRRR